MIIGLCSSRGMGAGHILNFHIDPEIVLQLQSQFSGAAE